MASREVKRLFFIQASVITAFFLSSCAAVKNNPATSCPANTALIQVLDGGMKSICGCAGVNGQVYGPGGQFTCTVAVGTMVEFIYSGITQPHNITINGVTSFGVRNPNPSNANQVDATPLNSTGSFTFSDSVTLTGGTFVVN